MRITNGRTYTGKIKLAVFDWAGTTVDFGCQAPIAAFIAGFKAKGIDIDTPTARGPMGMEKRDHIKTVTEMPAVAEAWQKTHGRGVTEDDIDEMYDEFVPHLLSILESNSMLIPGVRRAAEALNKKGIQVGSTTGYFKEAADLVAASAQKQGFATKVSISSSDVRHGRPYPWMIYRVMETLNVCPPEAVVNIGDTEVDMKAGRNAGVWTIGVASTGNEMGLTKAELDALDSSTRHLRITAVHEKLYGAGAHWVIDTMNDLPAIMGEINAHLADGSKP